MKSPWKNVLTLTIATTAGFASMEKALGNDELPMKCYSEDGTIQLGLYAPGGYPNNDNMILKFVENSRIGKYQVIDGLGKVTPTSFTVKVHERGTGYTKHLGVLVGKKVGNKWKLKFKADGSDSAVSIDCL